jgi:dsRNA-specific ribonuclease
MHPLSAQSAQSNSSQTSIRHLKRTFNPTLPASSWVVSKKIRKHPGITSKMPPPLPPVQSDSALAIFQHSSVKSAAQNERFGDSERLSFLGDKVLHMVVAEIQFEKRPMLNALILLVRAAYLSMHIAFIPSITFATERVRCYVIGGVL